jgi:hypothetical protein
MISTGKRRQEPWEPSQVQEMSALGACDTDGHCVTCSDEALQAQVLRVDAVSQLALVAIRGVTMEIDTSLVDEVQPGYMLLVHGGVAIALIDAS